MPESQNLPAASQYPLLPLRDVVVFPHMVIPLFVGGEVDQGGSAWKRESSSGGESPRRRSRAAGLYERLRFEHLQMLKRRTHGEVRGKGGTRALIDHVIDLRTALGADAPQCPRSPAQPSEVERCAGAALARRQS